jgi:hypothetical protein
MHHDSCNILREPDSHPWLTRDGFRNEGQEHTKKGAVHRTEHDVPCKSSIHSWIWHVVYGATSCVNSLAVEDLSDLPSGLENIN